MKIIQIIFVLSVFVLLGGFSYFAFVDIPIEQSAVSKNIPTEKFFDE